MLPKSYCNCYEYFFKKLLKLQQSLKSPAEENQKKLYQELQLHFTKEVMTLTGTELKGAIYHKWQSLQTEINRAFRLLQTEFAFFLTARQTTTNQQRLTNINNHLEKLIFYCQELLKE